MPLPPRASMELIPLVIFSGSSAQEGNEPRHECDGLQFIPRSLNSHPWWEQNTGADNDLRHLSSPGEISALQIHQERAQKLHFRFVLAFSRTSITFMLYTTDFHIKKKSGFFSCFNVPVSDIFLLQRCDILTWAYEERNAI